jgi:hypothetical protein
METFKSLVKAVEENNRINGAQWKDWNSASDIEKTYGRISILYLGVTYEFLNALIRDNGENLNVYLDAMDCIEYGQPFAR